MRPTTPTVTYSPVGRCIYCGNDTVKLSREHIIPLGLGGNLTLPRASCEKCADVTKRFERTCLRTSMGHFRIRHDMPTRRKKGRPESLPYHIVKTPGQIETIILPAHHLPRVLVLMKLAPPTLLSGDTPTPNFFKGDIWIWYEPDDLRLMENVYGAKQHIPGKLAISELVQMIAKIAYAHAISKMGFGAFKPLVLDAIFNRTNIPSHWVGGGADAPAIDGIMHQLRLDDDFRLNSRRYVVVDVRLFANLGAPTYSVFVGERHGL